MVEYRSHSLAGAEALACLALGRRHIQFSKNPAFEFNQQHGMYQNELEEVGMMNNFLFEPFMMNNNSTSPPSLEITEYTSISSMLPPQTTPQPQLFQTIPSFSPPKVIPFQFGPSFQPPPLPLPSLLPSISKVKSESTSKSGTTTKRVPIPPLPLNLPSPPKDLVETACDSLACLLEPGTRDRLPAGFLAVLSELITEGEKGTSGELRGESKLARAFHDFLYPSTSSSVPFAAPSSTSVSNSTLLQVSNLSTGSKKRGGGGENKRRRVDSDEGGRVRVVEESVKGYVSK